MKKKDLEKRIKLLEIQVDNLTREFDEAVTSRRPLAGFLEEAIQRHKEDNEPAMTQEEFEAAKPKMVEHMQEHLDRLHECAADTVKEVDQCHHFQFYAPAAHTEMNGSVLLLNCRSCGATREIRGHTRNEPWVLPE